MSRSIQNPYLAALDWMVSAGVDEAVQDSPNDRTAAFSQISAASVPIAQAIPEKSASAAMISPPASMPDFAGTAQARARAAAIAAGCGALQELAAAIAAFDGLAIKKTASSLVFADGSAAAQVMLIGDAPGTEDDEAGRPFVGRAGQLLDRITASIGLSRRAEGMADAVYVSNILNWRPPGNRTPTQSEIDISLPFIERHIALARPKLLILCGGVTAKALLGRDESLSKLRGKIHDYTCRTEGVSTDTSAIPAIVTYHPEFLLKTPAQKKSVWADMLMVRAYRARGA